jgi:hypothetical protein
MVSSPGPQAQAERAPDSSSRSLMPCDAYRPAPVHQVPIRRTLANDGDAGWSSPVARQAHNLKVVGSNPTPATNLFNDLAIFSEFFPRSPVRCRSFSLRPRSRQSLASSSVARSPDRDDDPKAIQKCDYITQQPEQRQYWDPEQRGSAPQPSWRAWHRTARDAH